MIEGKNLKIEIDPYIIETLMPDLVGHDRQPTAYFVYLFLWFEAKKSKKKAVQFSLREIAECTGVSRRSIQSATATLIRRKLIETKREHATDVPIYRVLCPWRR